MDLGREILARAHSLVMRAPLECWTTDLVGKAGWSHAFKDCRTQALQGSRLTKAIRSWSWLPFSAIHFWESFQRPPAAEQTRELLSRAPGESFSVIPPALCVWSFTTTWARTLRSGW